MELFSLEALALVAVSTKSSGGAPVHTLSVEEARGRVIIKDGNKTPNDDQSQSLTLSLGGITMTLSAIKAGTQRIEVAGEAVEGAKTALENFVKDGTFDADIAEAITKSKAAADKKIATNLAKKEALAAAGVDATVSGDVDLDAIDGASESNEEAPSLDGASEEDLG